MQIIKKQFASKTIDICNQFLSKMLETIKTAFNDSE